jgi:hypothetical protein
MTSLQKSRTQTKPPELYRITYDWSINDEPNMW